MIYMLKVNMLVAGAMFGLAGLFIGLMFVWTEARKYAHALRAMQRIALPVTRELFVISRVNSRNLNRNSYPGRTRNAY